MLEHGVGNAPPKINARLLLMQSIKMYKSSSLLSHACLRCLMWSRVCEEMVNASIDARPSTKVSPTPSLSALCGGRGRGRREGEILWLHRCTGNIKKHVNLSALCHIFVNRIFCYMHEHFNRIFFNGTRHRWQCSVCVSMRERERESMRFLPFFVSTIGLCCYCRFPYTFAAAFGLSLPIYLR